MDDDLKALISNRLDARETARQRAACPIAYCYVGACTPGGLAIAPNKSNTVVIRHGFDPMPARPVWWAYSEWSLRKWFEESTVDVGGGLRRWRAD